MVDITSERIDALIHGAIDLHCHSGPSIMERKLNHIEAAQEADAAGMRALAYKDHYYGKFTVGSYNPAYVAYNPMHSTYNLFSGYTRQFTSYLYTPLFIFPLIPVVEYVITFPSLEMVCFVTNCNVS